jgi:23S rRNA pseudouridine1911/1915/1917 synthase
MKIKVLYEDSNILAIDKPSGLLAHPDSHEKGETVYDIFKKKYPKLEIVHRLDRDTSGVMLLAKNKKAHEFLKGQFQDRTIKKIYHTIVSGSVKHDRGTIDKPIGRSPNDFRRYSAGRGARGEMREAVTGYKVLERFRKQAHKNFLPTPLPRVRGGTRSATKFYELASFTYLEIYPKTGRTHQIRVHMKYLNHPVVCDTLYNPDGLCPKDIKHMALHAKSIEFQDLKGKTIKVESPLPLMFKKVIK